MITGHIVFKNEVFHSFVAENILEQVLARTDGNYSAVFYEGDADTLLAYDPTKFTLDVRAKYGTALEVIAKKRFPKLYKNADNTVSTLEDVFASPNDFYFEEYTNAIPPTGELKYLDVSTCRLVNASTEGSVTENTIKCVGVSLEQIIDSHTLVNFNSTAEGITEGTLPAQDATLISYGLSPVNKLIDRVFAQQMQDNQQEFLVQIRLEDLGQPNTLADVQSEFELYYGEVTRLKDEAAAGLVSVDKYWEYVSKLLDALKNNTEMDQIFLDPIA